MGSIENITQSISTLSINNDEEEYDAAEATAFADYGFRAYLDLAISREFIVIKRGDREFYIKIAGTLDNVHYCGQDVATLLGYSTRESRANALKKYVPNIYKKSLEQVISAMEESTPSLYILGKSIDQLSIRERQSMYLTETGFNLIVVESRATYSKCIRKMLVVEILPSFRQIRQEIKDREHEQTKIALENTARALENEKTLRELAERDREKQKKLRELAEFKAYTDTNIKQTLENIDKRQIIYIMTSKNKSLKNEFKVGGIMGINHFKSRQSTYNTANRGDDRMYFVYMREVYNYENIEKTLKFVLNKFNSLPDKKSSEVYIHVNIYSRNYYNIL